MNIDLRSYDAREDLAAVGNDRGSGFIARRFDTENSSGHLYEV